ncbi:MAG: hypothetical protein RR834_09630 [Thermomonas sp.]
MKKHRLLLGQIALLTFASGLAQAAEIQPTRTVRNVDMATAGIGGIKTGTGSIALGGVSGSVQKAYLYWHGLNPTGPYNRAGISFDGQAITGRSLGVSGTNCWGSGGQSQAFEADVTALIAGNGSYSLSGLASGAGDEANGASLVVLYNDGNPGNNRDVVFYTGNDSIIGGSLFGDADGWRASLPAAAYSGGQVKATLHVADGQQSPYADGAVTFSTAGGLVTIQDTLTLFDGNSLPSAGSPRPPTGEGMYDVHAFDITAAFGSPGTRALNIQAPVGGDCTALIAATIDFAPGDAPVVGTPEGPATTCASEGYTGTKLTWCQNICEKGYSGTTLDMWIQRWVGRYRDLPYCAAD